MHCILAGAAGIVFVEILIRMALAERIGHLRSIVARIAAVLMSRRVSDHWKERALPRYSLNLLRAIRSIALALGFAAGAMAAFLGVSAVLEIPMLAFTLSIDGMVFLTALSIAYVKLRSGYGAADL